METPWEVVNGNYLGENAREEMGIQSLRIQLLEQHLPEKVTGPIKCKTKSPKNGTEY